MGTLNEDLSAIKKVEDKIIANKVARFAYTEKAYTTNDANGVAEYDVSKEQNIPTADASVLKVNETVLSKGYRAQASSITRMLVNHFFGRMSYNLNKVNDIVSNLIATLIGHRGTANGFATLDENGRIPYSQLPESAMEYKGQWNAETNTPALADGTGTKGDFYIVSVGGTQNLGSGNIQFFVNDRIIYDGSVWSRLSVGDVKTVNNVLPTNGNVALTGENIPVSSTDPTLLSAPLTTDRFADSSVTNAKIKDPISVDKGGTGATDAKNGFKNLANGLTQSQNPQDTEYMIYKSSGNWGLYTLLQFWEYIKSKISSVLGLTKDNYGGKAATATTADSAKSLHSQILDLSALDATKFYPAFCLSRSNFAEVAIYSIKTDDSASQNRIHFDISTNGWSDIPFTLNIREYACFNNSKIFIGCIGRGTQSGGWAIWLKGGCTYACFTRNCELSLKTSDYTYVTETYTVGTNYYGGTNTNVQIVFTPQSTITEGAYSSSPITAPVIKATTNFIGNVTGNATTAESADKIVPKYTSVGLSSVATPNTIKYIKLADCDWYQTGTLQVLLEGSEFQDTLVINFGGGNATTPTLCGHYTSRVKRVLSVIAEKGSAFNSPYSIYVKIAQLTSCSVYVALLKGACTINITESTTAPTNISEWPVNYGLFGDLTGTATNAYSAYSGMVHPCSTASGTKEKTVSIPGFTLTQGVCIRVVFINGNNVARPTLNVNGTGAKEICGPYGELLNATVTVTPPNISAKGEGICSWDYEIVLDLYYNGTEWRVIGNPIVMRFSENSTVHKNISMLGNLQTSILQY